MDPDQLSNIWPFRVKEAGEGYIPGIDLAPQRLDDFGCARRPVEIGRSFAAVVPGGQEKIAQVADMVIMVVGNKDGIDLLRGEAGLEELTGDAPAGVK